MNQERRKSEILLLIKDLHKVIDKEENNDEREEYVEDIVKRFIDIKEEVTILLLKETKIGIIMKKIRKLYYKNINIVSMTKSLCHYWKQQYREHYKDMKCDVKEVSESNQKDRKRMKKMNNLVNDDERKMKYCLKNNTFTITFGDQAENHVGMQKIGSLSNEGFHLEDLVRAQEWFENKGVECELIALHEELLSNDCNDANEAYVLVARDGVKVCGEEGHEEEFKQDVFREQVNLNPDTMAFMYGRVVNKHARYNLCFGNFDQQADYQNGKGTVVSFNNVPALNTVRNMLPHIIGHKAEQLEAEGNYYYDLSKCGIGYHGDAERMKVVALRLGASMELCYAWFQNSKPISQRKIITLHHGDMYFMSQKATGQDWKKKVIPTLRHAAGCQKFTRLPNK